MHTYLTDWLLNGATDVPKEVRAFAFNLFELGPNQAGKFAMEWIGAEQYSKQNDDWACEEIWSAEPRILDLPLDLTGDSWTTCASQVKTALQAAIAGLPEGHVLKGKLPVAIGGEQMDLQVLL